jgi:protein-L-isoaspartate(D-aspartate) O-methyltransferase
MSLIDELVKSGYLKTPAIIDAFRKIKRQDFVLPEDRERAEVDAPLSIGHGQTISQPATVAFMLEKLQPQAGEKILDIGCGSGWTMALLAQIVGARGEVYGVERISQLKDFAASNANKYNFVKSGTVHIICSDGWYGLPEFSPFDKILVSAVAEEIPDKLLEQLKPGGRLVMPVGRKFESQSIIVVDKIKKNKFSKKEYPGFIFVPLIKNN